MKILEALQSFHDRLLGLAAHFSFDKRNPVDLHRVALYGSMLELTGAICALLKTDARIGIPSLFRSFLEARVELTNLMADPGYIENMRASHIEQWLKVLKEAKTKKNPYLTSIAKLPDLDDQIAKEKAELQRLKNAGRPPLDVFQRFERAKMVQEYRSLYNSLSCDAHSNIRALISRHINLKENDFEVTYYKDEPIESFGAILDSTAVLLLQLSCAMQKAYDPQNRSEVEAMLSKLKNIRQDCVA
jgi:hypothetical protein